MATSFADLRVPPEIPPRSTSAALDPQPTTATEEEDLKAPEVVDESGKRLREVLPPPRSSWRRSCPTKRLVLVLMAFCGILTLSVALLGIQRAQFNKDQGAAWEALRSFNRTVSVELRNLQHKRNSTGWKLAALEKTMNDEVEKMEKAKKRIQSQLDSLQQDARTFHCGLMEMKSNGSKTGCCPKGWQSFEESCYWMSSTPASWNLAKLDCEKKNAHLVIINSPNESSFVNQRKRSNYLWIGLTDVSGNWKWVDGSSYSLQPEDWNEGQPDHWYGHGLGGGEDCVHMLPSGLWNDNHCSRLYTWMCELELRL
ncbi:asialoglycoprotein receptor 1-like [Rhineura floridana]|uniref:asialoglycoprotein receptor 1-like n=1 Tax=Rhineura floridana TaxID=261503 RepID=UPI002AC84DAE|nr:asialoglycoprotein receptor 1-like [Rhineura floridana]